MKFGAPFLGAYSLKDPIMIRDYVQTVEELGYSHLFTDEILLNDDPKCIYHESLTLFAYLSAVTERIIFTTGIMVLPKRQTVMVARQAAEVDVLSGSRLRLGVGVGWKLNEFEALEVDFHSRGRLIEEQILLLKELWTREKVNFNGTYHTLKDIGINLLPVQRPIPIWIGGTADKVIRRAAKLAGGWIADEAISDDLELYIEKLWNYLDEYGKTEEDFKIIKYLHTGKITRSDWASKLDVWESMGVTHTVVIPSSGWDQGKNLSDHLDELQSFADEAGLKELSL
jgi:probable F420-dependent oxidoreductase